MPDEAVFHITTRDASRDAEASGSYEAPSLAAEGFVHCSTRAQVVETANRFFHGEDGLVLLCIDPSLLRAPLRYEAPMTEAHSPDAGRFPHIYGPLNLDAVTQVVPFPAGADGSFVLPAELHNSHAGPAPVAQATQLTEETAQKNAYGSIGVGLVLLLATGLLSRKLSGGE
jgi:uncharacterized protein (DUF952 family)